ncbi:MAG: Asp-tRNA(Asn)/Glu-tRNA(Gln) amidotransferase subunit GatC [Kofleriaceae bacterium]
MANLERKEVDEIALLARLHLDEDERTKMQEDLGAILEHFAVLASVDTNDIAPMTHAVPMDLPLRNDDVFPSLSVDDALGGAPKREGDFIVVPAILPGDNQ